jgi:thymidylate kinase
VARTLIWGVRLKSRIRPQPHLSISISGLDGAGKTAHALALVEALRLAEIRTAYCWSRGGSTGLLGGLSRVRKRLAGGGRQNGAWRSEPDAISRRRERLGHPLVRFVWAWLVALDQIGTFAAQLALPRLLGRVAVFDRYAYDTAVEMEASLPTEARWSRLAIEALLRLTPRPDLAYLLEVDPATARARKADEAWHADQEHERQRYQLLARRFGLRRRSNDGGFAALSDDLIREVMQAFMTDYETWLNALFLANPSQKNPPDLAWARAGVR